MPFSKPDSRFRKGVVKECDVVRQRPKTKTEKSHFASRVAHIVFELSKLQPSPQCRARHGTFLGIEAEAGDVWSCHGDGCQQRLPLLEPLWPCDPHTELE